MLDGMSHSVVQQPPDRTFLQAPLSVGLETFTVLMYV